MANIEHVNITDPNIHEPKGVGSATDGQVYVADGSGSGAWTTYNWHGWGNYTDVSSGTQTFNTTPARLQIDGGTTLNSYLPRDIRGTSELWDTTNDKILPIAVGDSYNIRLDLPFTAKTGAPASLIMQLDIGGLTSPTNVIITRDISTSKSPPFTVSVGFPIFSLSTFLANGGQFFLSTDTGTVDIELPSITIVRTGTGEL